MKCLQLPFQFLGWMLDHPETVGGSSLWDIRSVTDVDPVVSLGEGDRLWDGAGGGGGGGYEYGDGRGDGAGEMHDSVGGRRLIERVFDVICEILGLRRRTETTLYSNSIRDTLLTYLGT